MQLRIELEMRQNEISMNQERSQEQINLKRDFNKAQLHERKAAE